MPITELHALRLLLREELQAELKPFRAEVGKRFDEIASHIDGLYQRDEKREQEYFSIREQINGLSKGLRNPSGPNYSHRCGKDVTLNYSHR